MMSKSNYECPRYASFLESISSFLRPKGSGVVEEWLIELQHTLLNATTTQEGKRLTKKYVPADVLGRLQAFECTLHYSHK